MTTRSLQALAIASAALSDADPAVRGKVNEGSRSYDVISLAEAFRRRGFPLTHIQCDPYVLARSEEILVGFSPDFTANLNANGKGECFSFCGGDQLFGFCEVQAYGESQKDRYFTIARSYGLVVDIVTTQNKNHDGTTWESRALVYMLVRPC